jgi:predicted Co/Zn/Cd cation transporter (cation efflux family)
MSRRPSAGAEPAAQGRTETRARSLAATVFVAAFGVTMGLVSGSSAVVFDGVCSVVNVGMTLPAPLVSSDVIARDVKNRIMKADRGGRAGP